MAKSPRRTASGKEKKYKKIDSIIYVLFFPPKPVRTKALCFQCIFENGGIGSREKAFVMLHLRKMYQHFPSLSMRHSSALTHRQAWAVLCCAVPLGAHVLLLEAVCPFSTSSCQVHCLLGGCWISLLDKCKHLLRVEIFLSWSCDNVFTMLQGIRQLNIFCQAANAGAEHMKIAINVFSHGPPRVLLKAKQWAVTCAHSRGWFLTLSSKIQGSKMRNSACSKRWFWFCHENSSNDSFSNLQSITNPNTK